MRGKNFLLINPEQKKRIIAYGMCRKWTWKRSRNITVNQRGAIIQMQCVGLSDAGPLSQRKWITGIVAKNTAKDVIAL